MHGLIRTTTLTLLLTAFLGLSACSFVSGLWSDTAELDATSEKVERASTKRASIVGAEHTTPSVQALRELSTANSIDIRWSNNVDYRQPASPLGFSLPAAMHTADGERIVIGGQDQRVRIFDAAGSELARIGLAAACESGSLLLSNGLVVLGDLAGTLYALDIRQAKIVWRFTLSSALIGSPVAVDDGFIVQTSNNQIYRFSNDGKKLWSYSGILGGLSMHLTPSPVVYKQRVYAAMSNGDVVALKATNGSFIWKRQLLLSNKAAVMSELKVPVAQPLLITAEESGRDEDVLLVSVFQGDMSFLSLQDGSTLSSRALSLKSAPLLLGKQVIVADTSGAVSALNAANGETLWKKKLSNSELTGPVLWQGSLWVADDKAVVYRLSSAGKLLARTELDGRIDRAPITADEGVLVRNNLGSLYMLR